MTNAPAPQPDPTSQLLGILAGALTLLAAVVSRLPRFNRKRDNGERGTVDALAAIISEKQQELDELEAQLHDKDELIDQESAEITRLNGVIEKSNERKEDEQ